MATSYGLIGAGMMGREHLANLRLLPEVEVRIICEPDVEQRRLSEPLAPDAQWVASLDEARTSAAVDAWIVATPNDTHFAVLKQILAGKPCGVLLEKPAVTNWEQAKEIRPLVGAWPKPIWVAMEYRYMPPLARFLERCASGELGHLRMLTIREHRFPFLPKVGDWNRFNARTGGTLVEKCCHFFDLMHLIYQEKPAKVYASGGVDVNHLDESYEGRTPDIMDNAYVVLDFPSGRRAMLELCMFAEGAEFQEEITVVGDKARLECRIPGPARFWPGHEERAAELILSPRDPKGPIREVPQVDPDALAAGDHYGATFYQHQKFLAVVQGRQEVEVSFEDGLAAVRVGLAAQESIERGQAVNLEW